MKKIILLLFAVLPTVMYAQETEKIIEKHESPNYIEIYYVLKSDKSIRHGNYQKLGHKNSLLVNGYYKNGLKDSTWTEYYWGGEKLKKKGNYADDKKHGVWEFYLYNGEIEQKYDYTSNELVYFILEPEEKDKEYKEIVKGGFKTVKLERPPLYIGGSIMIKEIINENLNFPAMAKENKVSGEVHVIFTIDTIGKMSNVKIMRGIGSGCDEEAIRVVKLLPDNWIPALRNSQLVAVEHTLKIRFSYK